LVGRSAVLAGGYAKKRPRKLENVSNSGICKRIQTGLEVGSDENLNRGKSIPESEGGSKVFFFGGGLEGERREEKIGELAIGVCWALPNKSQKLLRAPTVRVMRGRKKK